MIQSSRCSRVHHSGFKNLLIMPTGYGLQGNEAFFCFLVTNCREISDEVSKSVSDKGNQCRQLNQLFSNVENLHTPESHQSSLLNRSELVSE